MDRPAVQEIRTAMKENGAVSDTLVSDLHVWRVGRSSYSCALAVVTHDHALTPEVVRDWFAQHEEIVHSTIEVRVCT